MKFISPFPFYKINDLINLLQECVHRQAKRKNNFRPTRLYAKYFPDIVTTSQSAQYSPRYFSVLLRNKIQSQFFRLCQIFGV